MKTRKHNTIIILLLLLAHTIAVKAQNPITYSFHYQESEIPGDSIPDLFCVMKLSELMAYSKVRLAFNNKTRNYQVKNLTKGESKEYKQEGEFIYFKIEEKLEEPFVSIYAIDKSKNEKQVHLKNGRGDIVNPEQRKKEYKKHKVRNDSMDFVRRHDNVYVGKDGKPRYKDKAGQEYIIEKDHVRKSRSNK